MADRYEDDPEFSAPYAKPIPGRGFSIVRVILGVVISIMVSIMLLLPATRTSRGAARRSQCVNNLKQIALALQDYERAYGTFPPASTMDPAGRPLHSWRTLILPYLEQESLYERIDLAKPWDDPANSTAVATGVGAYACPEDRAAKNTTVYLANVGPDGFLAPGRPRRAEEVTDGLSNTLAVIEAGADDAVPWMAPTDADAALVLRLDPKAGLNHAGGTNAALGDGSVRFLKATIPAPIRRALLSIAGGEIVSSDAF